MLYWLRSSEPPESNVSVVCLSWETIHLHGEAWISHHRLRYRLFVERQGWDVPSYRGIEHDEFDTPVTQYLLSVDDAGLTRGMVRLLPTTQPYMLKKLWPGMVRGELPESDAVWEATRFGCDPTLDPRARRRVVNEILCATLEFGIQHRLEGFLVVMPVRLLRSVIARAGYCVRVLGGERMLGNLPAAAAYLEVSPEVLGKVRRCCAMPGPVLPASLSVAA